jgi:hypothetical protein
MLVDPNNYGSNWYGSLALREAQSKASEAQSKARPKIVSNQTNNAKIQQNEIDEAKKRSDAIEAKWKEEKKKEKEKKDGWLTTTSDGNEKFEKLLEEDKLGNKNYTAVSLHENSPTQFVIYVFNQLKLENTTEYEKFLKEKSETDYNEAWLNDNGPEEFIKWFKNKKPEEYQIMQKNLIEYYNLVFKDGGKTKSKSKKNRKRKTKTKSKRVKKNRKTKTKSKRFP